MPIFNVLGNLEKGLTGNVGVSINDDDSVINFLNPSQATYMSARDALKNSDIYSVIFKLSGDLALSKLVTENLKVKSLLDNPTPTANNFSFWQSMYAQMLLGGESFAYRWRNRNGQDIRLEYLRPSQVQTFLLSDGSGLTYNISFDSPNIGIKEAVPSSDIIHLRMLSTNGGKTALSPLYSLANELSIKKSSDDLTKSALDQSVLAPGILRLQDGGLSNWKDKRGRSKSFMRQLSTKGPIVLDQLEEYSPLEIKSDISKLLSQADWTGDQIAKVYGLKGSDLAGKSDQQSSVTMLMEQYMRGLNRFSTPIESELSFKFKTQIEMDLSQVSDLLHTSLLTTTTEMVKSNVLTSGEAKLLLKQKGYLPNDFPDIAETNVETKKGGEK
ncbi:phage portal protein [Weissella oryzae SG25]|uniref:Phage portal protein n=1 Tax=Weissella oryzae (strain DSM 25784 / JCM 18191 / LMG 30913 / SG25) TaxID=1329250 RepID=A0A069CWW3_WEIOS|nr:phage portal protein [Weissella oryzae]GAK31964.1 phage portal protein [Weissella oryzae SG25]